MAEPSEPYLWAESAAGGDVTNPSGKRTAGYLFEDPFPHDEANYIFRALGRWIDYLYQRGRAYPTLEALVADAVKGDTGYVAAPDYATADLPFQSLEESTTGLDVPHGIDVDGEYVYVCAGTGVVERRGRSSLDTTDVDYSAALSGTPTAFTGIAADGTHVAVGYTTAGNSFVDVFDATAGTLVGTYSPGVTNAPRGMVMLGGFTFVGIGDDLQRLPNTSPATPSASYDHSALITGVVASRGKVVAMGNDRTTNSGAASIGDNLVVLDIGLSIEFGRSLTNGQPNADQVTCDGTHVFFIDTVSGPAIEIGKVGLDGRLSDLGDAYDFTDTEDLATHAHGIAVDDRYLYLAVDSELYVYDKETMARVDTIAASGTGGTGDGCIASDGDQVYILGTTTGPTYFLESFEIPHFEKKYYRADGTERGLPWSMKAIPVGA